MGLRVGASHLALHARPPITNIAPCGQVEVGSSDRRVRLEGRPEGRVTFTGLPRKIEVLAELRPELQVATLELGQLAGPRACSLTARLQSFGSR